MINYSQSGDVLTITVAATITAGKLFDLGNGMFGVAQSSGVSGDSIAFVRSGRFSSMIMTAGNTAEKGDGVYFDSTISGVSVKAVGPKVGVLAEDVGASDAAADVILTGEVGAVFHDFVAVLNATGGLSIGSTAFGPEFPIGARVVGTWINVMTTLTSGTDAATIAIGWPTDDASGVDVAIAISDATNPWDNGFRLSDTTDAAPSSRMTARRRLTAVVAVEALTAGTLAVSGQYIVTAA